MMPGLSIAMIAACPFPYPRGTPIRIQRLAESLCRRGHAVDVMTYHLGSPVKDTPFVIRRTPRLATYGKVSPGPTYQKLAVLDPLLAATIWREIARRRYDMIHAHHFEGLLAALPARWRSGLPLVFDAHTLLESELVEYGLGLPALVKRAVGGIFDRMLPRLADHVIAVTDTIKEKLLAHGGLRPDRVTVVTNGVEFESFQIDAGRIVRSPGEKHLVFAGNLAAYQGVDYAFQALRAVLPRHPRTRLMLVTSSSFESYERRTRDLGIREQIDVVPASFDELPLRLAQADIAVNPRVNCDGIPQKLLNYMAAGKAIISFAGSAKTIEDGVTGLVVPDGDADAFAVAALRLLDDERLLRRLGEAARDCARRRYTWERCAEATEGIYERLLARRAGGPRP